MVSYIFPDHGLSLLHVPRTCGTRLTATLGPPAARHIGHLPGDAPPAVAVVRHPEARFFSALRAVRDGPGAPLPGMTPERALEVLENPQVPFDGTRGYPMARFKAALIPQSHPFHALHRAARILHLETLERDWPALGHPPLAASIAMSHSPAVPDDLRDRLAQAYADDYRQLGYTPGTPLPTGPATPPPDPGPQIWALWPALFEGAPRTVAEAAHALPDPDAPLAPFLAHKVAGRRGDPWPGRTRDLIEHFRNLQPELADRTRLTHLLAATIVVLRRAGPQPQALQLFERITGEIGPQLVSDLPLRWLRSSCDTFVDHGRDGETRAIGLAGTLLLNTLKLYETERRMFAPPRPWPPNARWAAGGLILDGVKCFWVAKGDMVDNMLGRLETVEQGGNPAAPFLREILSRAYQVDTVYKRLAQVYGVEPPPVLDDATKRRVRRILGETL